MAVRQTRKAGIPKTRGQELSLQRTLDAIVERLEVLDGLRGDNLDKAVTFRDLGDAGAKVSIGGAGGAVINQFPTAPGDGPTVGPAAAPTNLAAAETFLALLLTWDNASFNLQHVEVWRSATDNLSTANMIGTTVSPQFIDYVGANATYYYWVRSVGTDGSYSAYNATAGTAGTTGINPGDLTINPLFFTLDDGTGTALPFLTDGLGNIGIDGDLIVDGTIRALSLVANSIGANQINAVEINTTLAAIDTLLASVIRTAESPAYRVELEDQASTAYPLWYGSGAKGATTGRFFVDQNGNVYVKGLLDAGMIAQSFFAPATTDYNSFRIACQYPSGYSGGVYSGTAAHICPVIAKSQSIAYRLAERGPFYGGFLGTFYTYTGTLPSLYGPAYTGVTAQYGRLGSNTELLHVTLLVSVTAGREPTDPGSTKPTRFTGEVDLQYQYNGDTQWLYLTQLPLTAYGSGTVTFSAVVSTRATAFDSLTFRYRVRGLTIDLVPGDDEFDTVINVTADLISSSLVVTTANFGYSDNTLTTLTQAEVTTDPLDPENLDAKPGVIRLPGFDGGIIP